MFGYIRWIQPILAHACHPPQFSLKFLCSLPSIPHPATFQLHLPPPIYPVCSINKPPSMRHSLRDSSNAGGCGRVCADAETAGSIIAPQCNCRCLNTPPHSEQSPGCNWENRKTILQKISFEHSQSTYYLKIKFTLQCLVFLRLLVFREPQRGKSSLYLNSFLYNCFNVQILFVNFFCCIYFANFFEL